MVQADRWAKQNKGVTGDALTQALESQPGVTGDALTQALESQPWDPSVKSLVNFPQVLAMMSEKLDWTQKLGDAFLAQQKEVMDTVQRLRQKAVDAGSLKTTPEQQVIVEKETIVIQKEEILNRRIAANELSTVQTLLAVIDAQREYAMKDRDGDGIREYAQKFRSDTGRQNGLPGEEPSPLGELVADARAEGYSQKGKTRQGPVPFHGYYFRILTKQGKHAPGGAFDYLVKDNLIGGVAVLAYPAVYGSSGVMTFMVNHLGVVYEKDLGKNTAKTAAAMQSFDPDKSWRKVD